MTRSKFFIKGIIPANGIGNYGRDNTRKVDLISRHSEIARQDMSYVWSKEELRTVNFETKPNVVTLGCSITFGLGLPVEKTWPILLQEKLREHGNYTVGNISYNGASITKCVSSFFGMINDFDYLPEYVVCNFPNFERGYFVMDKYPDSIGDMYWYEYEILTKDKAPFSWGKILPIEWITYANLEAIKTLEVFCKTNNIKLIWSTWSVLKQPGPNFEDFIKDNFKYYVPDITREVFPDNFEKGLPTRNPNEILQYFKMHDWDSIQCHYDEYIMNQECFDHAYDYHMIPVDYIDGDSPLHPHPGAHRHLHWAEMYYGIINKDL